jgi:hypothetical protein
MQGAPKDNMFSDRSGCAEAGQKPFLQLFLGEWLDGTL